MSEYLEIGRALDERIGGRVLGKDGDMPVFYRRYESAFDVAAHGALTETNDRHVWSEYSSHDGGKGFTGTQDYNEACNLAKLGWPEGAQKMLHVQKNASVFAAGNADLGAWDYDVGGAYPSVPLAVAGEPEHMVNPADEMSDQMPVLRLAVPITYPHFVGQTAVINYGAAIVGWLEDFEKTGIAVEVSAICFHEQNGMGYMLETMVRASSEPLRLDHLSFCLAHPSMLRRLTFAVLEIGATPRERNELPGNIVKKLDRTASGYGKCSWYPPRHLLDQLEPGVMMLPCLHGSNSTHYIDHDEMIVPDDARRIVQERLDDLAAEAMDLAEDEDGNRPTPWRE